MMAVLEDLRNADQPGRTPDERLRDVLTVLAEGHYIEPMKSADGMVYDFRWPLVKKWWKERRS